MKKIFLQSHMHYQNIVVLPRLKPVKQDTPRTMVRILVNVAEQVARQHRSLTFQLALPHPSFPSNLHFTQALRQEHSLHSACLSSNTTTTIHFRLHYPSVYSLAAKRLTAKLSRFENRPTAQH